MFLHPPDDCVEFLKGLKNSDTDFGDGFDYTLFSDSGEIPELPGWNGSSINWDLPSGGALKQLFEQVGRDGSAKFKMGAIRIPRVEMDRLIQRHGPNELAYELREENGNIYHGHILFSSKIQPKRKTTFCAMLANCFVEIHRQE